MALRFWLNGYRTNFKFLGKTHKAIMNQPLSNVHLLPSIIHRLHPNFIYTTVMFRFMSFLHLGLSLCFHFPAGHIFIHPWECILSLLLWNHPWTLYSWLLLSFLSHHCTLNTSVLSHHCILSTSNNGRAILKVWYLRPFQSICKVRNMLTIILSCYCTLVILSRIHTRVF